MGQTSLLLMVIAVVLIGIAIVLGTSAFVRGITNSNHDSLLNEAIHIATLAQVWKNTPEVLGGSIDSLKSTPYDYSNLSFPSLGMDTVKDTDALCYKNTHGVYALEAADDGLWIYGTSVSHQNRVVLRIVGSSERDIDFRGGDGFRLSVRGGYPLYRGDPTTSVNVENPMPCLGLRITDLDGVLAVR